ncbi:hypothetical protein [Ruminococcus flavefaciens]|uniref:Glycosyltransferase subfamily 4-like N-terminal domain-containing protein n=1 Tax=Ruminococcus flavefaciens 007c TaxID=1341157 RepID=W7UJX7_RUMFL|nr:hypothetical protein [Ruminococcus flavefaciens]EWM54103.1 hypothetical protein RF007C_01135 [Ruminococcus flavefaciens 007c]
MKRIIVAEILYPIGHKTYDRKMIELLAHENSLTVLNYKGFLDEFVNDNIEYVELPKQIIIKKHEPFIQSGIYYNLRVIKRIIKNKKYDAIIFLSCNNSMLKIIGNMFKGTKVFVIHHNDIDALKTEKQLKKFKRGMNYVEHITLADFITEGLAQKTGCPITRIHTIPHPLISRIFGYDDLQERDKTLVGLGLSNDEAFIDSCIEIDKSLPNPLNYTIVLRSKIKEYKGKSLKIIKGYLDDETYNRYYYSASAIIICYPKQFQNRYSSTLINAIAQNGRVIFNEFPMGEAESKKYPHIMSVVKRPNDLFTINESFFCSPIDQRERELFLEEHSDDKVIESLHNILE